MRVLATYRAFLSIQFQSAYQYRGDFLAGLAGIAVLNLTDIILLYLVVSQFSSIGGWSFWDLAFMTFFYMLVLGIENLFGVHYLDLEKVIRDGTFDRYLLRPLPSIAQFAMKELNVRYFDHLVLGIIGVLICSTNLELKWNAGTIAYIILNVLASAVALGAWVLALCAIAFWTIRSSGFVFSTMEIQEIVQHYPIHIFGRPFAALVTFVLPFALMSYYPSSFLLGKPPLPFEAWLQWMTPVVAILMVAICLAVWRLGVARYESVGN